MVMLSSVFLEEAKYLMNNSDISRRPFANVPQNMTDVMCVVVRELLVFGIFVSALALLAEFNAQASFFFRRKMRTVLIFLDGPSATSEQNLLFFWIFMD